MIRKGDTVKILAKFQDDGDSDFTWVAVSNQDGDRVAISPVMPGLRYPPIQVVKVEWLDR